MRRILLLALSALSLARPVTADEPSTIRETRKHFQVRGTEDTLLYDVTQIVRIGDEVQEKHLLIQDHNYGKVVIRWVWSYKEQVIIHRLSDLSDRAFIQHNYKTPFTSKTRLETMAESHANPLVSTTPGFFKIETNGGEFEGIHTEWTEHGTLRAIRNSLRLATDRFLLDAIERMRGSFAVTDQGSNFYQTVGRFLVYDNASDSAVSIPVEPVHGKPDCDFDDSFGYPCSEKQLARLEKAAREKTVLVAY